MARSCFSRVLLFTSLLLLFSNGFGRKLVDHTSSEHGVAASDQEKSREMMQLDYAETGANVNGRSGFLFVPPPPPPPPGPPPPGFGY